MLPEWSADRVTPNAAISLGIRVNLFPQPVSSWVRSRAPVRPWPHLVSFPKVTQLQPPLATLLFLKQASWQPCSSPKASTRVLSSAQNMLPFVPNICGAHSLTYFRFLLKCHPLIRPSLPILCQIASVPALLPKYSLPLFISLFLYSTSLHQILHLLVYLLLIPLPRGIWTV